jgi:hypothetical protein
MDEHEKWLLAQQIGGDETLRSGARECLAVLRGKAQRIGQDGFAFLLWEVSGGGQSAEYARSVGERIVELRAERRDGDYDELRPGERIG